MTTPTLSIVVPVYNEGPILVELVTRCLAAGTATGVHFELLMVDDCSQDQTQTIAASLTDPSLCWLHLPQNLGQFQATVQGLRAAKGDSVAVLDGDLQDPPECLTDLISRLNTAPHVDVVFAVKQQRQDPIWLRTGSHLYHLALRGMGRSLPSGAGSYCVMRHPIAETVSQLQNTHLNLAIAVAVQRPVWATLPYAKAARHDGRSRVGALGLVAEAMGSLCYAARSR